VLQGKLYKKSITGVLQRCVTPQEGQEILKDIHAGVCGVTSQDFIKFWGNFFCFYFEGVD
jgi:hypothetical protein